MKKKNTFALTTFALVDSLTVLCGVLESALEELYSVVSNAAQTNSISVPAQSVPAMIYRDLYIKVQVMNIRGGGFKSRLSWAEVFLNNANAVFFKKY